MMLTVQREPSVDGATLGKLFVNGAFECDTLEDVIREVEGVPVADWKIAEQTAIPHGTYTLTLENSPRFGPNTMSVNDVPGYDCIRIHGGNTAQDTHGCLLVGHRSADNVVSSSQAALTQLKVKVVTAIHNGDDVQIEYLQPLMTA